jgi:hypothetical protein
MEIPLAGASADRGVDVEVTKEHVNRAADRGCRDSTCSFFSIYFLISHFLKAGNLVEILRKIIVPSRLNSFPRDSIIEVYLKYLYPGIPESKA